MVHGLFGLRHLRPSPISAPIFGGNGIQYDVRATFAREDVGTDAWDLSATLLEMLGFDTCADVSVLKDLICARESSLEPSTICPQSGMRCYLSGFFRLGALLPGRSGIIFNRTEGSITDSGFSLDRFGRDNLKNLFPFHWYMTKTFPIICVKLKNRFSDFPPLVTGMSGSVDEDGKVIGLLMGGGGETGFVIPIQHCLDVMDAVLARNSSSVVHLNHKHVFRGSGH